MPAKRQADEEAEARSIDEEALAGPDGPPPRKLTPEWVAVNLMDITAHLMAAIDKAAGPLDRLADAAEDATAHVAHSESIFPPAPGYRDDCPDPGRNDFRYL